MEGAEEEESDLVPPIATTPPHPGMKEEPLSQSSSGTQLSSVSGLSLGELIRLRSVINREMDMWCQPYTEADTSNQTLAVGQKSGQASGICELPELPSMEEGSISLTEDSRRQPAPNLTHPVLLVKYPQRKGKAKTENGLPLAEELRCSERASVALHPSVVFSPVDGADTQDSSLSPNLPLLTTCSAQGRTLFNETLFQQTGMDFLPLRGIPDISLTASQASLQRNEVVRLSATAADSDSSADSFPHSKHPHASYPGAENKPGLSQKLPSPFGERGQAGEEEIPPPSVNTKASPYKNDSFGTIGSQKLGSQQLATSLPPKESQEIVSGPDPFLLDSNVPVPFLLEMLEKEVGISKRSGFLSSSDSSSGRSVLGKENPEENERSGVAGNVVRSGKEPETLVVPPQEERRTFPELDSLRLLSDSVGLKNFSGSEHLSTNVTQSLMPSRKPCPVLGDACVITRMSPRRSLNEQQMQHPVSEEKKKELVSVMSDSTFDVSASLRSAIVGAEYGDPCKELMNSMVGIQPGASKIELTISGFSVEREHKDTHTPPSFNEGSFFGALAHPAHHSTPAVFPTRSLKQELHGAPLSVKPFFPSPLSRLREETSQNSFANACSRSVEELRVPSVDNRVQPPAEEPLALQGGQETSEHSGALQPLKGRIQSLPSLNFLEKVGAWNVSESAERMTDALALGAPSGASPRQKAYSAIADSLNHILLKQQSQVNLREGLTASLHGSSTVFGLQSYEKKSPCALSLTRSQSESSVIVIDREISRTDISWARIQKDSFQPAEPLDRGLGTHGVKRRDADAEDPVTQRYTAVLVSTISSDEETMDGDGRKRGSWPDSIITSERVAELLREEANLAEGQESSSSSQTNTTEMLSCHQIGMGHFNDASPESLNQVIISGAGSCAGLRPPSRQMSSRSSAASGQLQSSLEEGTKTPDEAREMNIEERIPVYLRNLGIDQSPSSILTPFMPRGPVREIELSPTELRTLKASTDPLMQRLQSSEGDSHSAIDALQSSSRSVIDGMQSSFNSSALSVPALEGPNAGADTLLPAEPSLKSSKDLLGHWSVACQNLEPSALKPCPPEITSESPAKPESAEQINPLVLSSIHSGNETSTECIQLLADTSDAKGANQEKLASGYSSPKKDEMNEREEISSAVRIPEGEREDSFIGSKMLKEIDRLLAESETRTLNIDSSLALSSSSSQDVSSSVTQTKGVDASEDSVEGSRPRLRRMWSWDEALTRPSVRKDTVFSQTFCLANNLKWEGLPPADSKSNEQTVLEQSRSLYQIDEEEGVAQRVRRSEPEGCNSVTVNVSLPVFVSSAGDASLRAPCDLQEALDSTSDILGDPQQAFEKAREADSKGTDSNRESENSSSVDSLGVQVKNLLHQGCPAMHTIPWGKEEEHTGCRMNPVLVEACVACCRGDAGVQESDKSGSLDSLAARVKTILEEERPVMHATQILQSTEEEEKRVRALLKLKLASSLSEEDRLLLDDIKKEHFLGSRMAGNTQDQQWGNGYKRISSHSPVQTLSPEPSILSDASELHQTHCISTEVDVVQADAALPGGADPGTDTALPGDSETTAMNAIHSPACSQLHANSDKPFNRTQRDCAALCSDTNIHLMGLTEAINAEGANVSPVAHLAADGSSTENGKQITSITFASRKRSPFSSPVSCGGLPGGQPPLDAEEVKSSKQQMELPKLCATASPTHALEMDDGPSSSRGHYERMAVGVGEDESHQGKPTLSAEDSQIGSVEQRIGSVTDTCKDGWAASHVATRVKNHDRPTGGGYEREFSPEETMSGWPLSTDPPEQKDQLTNGLEGFVRMPEAFTDKNKESKFTFDSFPCEAGDAYTGNSGRPPSSFPDRTVSPSSPTRKALSGVHITLSPKRIDLGLQSQMNTGVEMRRADALKSGPHQTALSTSGLSLETTSKLKPTELSPKYPDSAYFLRTAASSDCLFRRPDIPFAAKRDPHQSRELGEGRHDCPVHALGCVRVLESDEQWPGDNCKIAASSQTERLSSDAITQITTESPERTTYSSEIFVGRDDDGVGAPPPQKHRIGPSSSAPALTRSSIVNREVGKPLLLPYKPPGSSEMYYVPCPKEALKLSRVRSETTVESTHSGSNDAIPPDFPAHVLGSSSENPPDALAIKHKEGIYSKRSTPKIAWTEEKIAAPEGGRVNAENRDPLDSAKTTHSDFRSSQFYLHQPVPLRHEIDFLAGDETLRPYPESGHSTSASGDFCQYKAMPGRSKASLSLNWRRSEEKFSPLNAELDYSLLEDSRFREASERDSRRKELEDSIFTEALERDSRRKELEDSRFSEAFQKDSGREELEAGDSKFRESLERVSRRKELEDSRFRESLERDSRRKELEDSRLKEGLERDSRRKELEAGDARFRESLERDSRRKELEDSRFKESFERDSGRKEHETGDSRFREGLERDSRRKELEAGDARFRESLERVSRRKELEDSRFKESFERDSGRKEHETGDTRFREGLERDSRRKELEPGDKRFRESLERDSRRKELESGDKRFRESLERDSRRKELESGDKRFRESLERDSPEDSRFRESFEKDSRRKELEDSRFKESFERDSRRKEHETEDSRFREGLERDSRRKEPEDSRFREFLERDLRKTEPTKHEARKIDHKVAKDLPLPSSQASSPRLKQVATLPGRPSIPLTASLDELWSKYLERQKQHHQQQQQQQQQHPGGSSRHELSLVERLDRLARLLQNPVRQSLMSAKERRSNIQEERRRKEPKKSRSPGKATHKGTLASHRSIREAEESPDTTSNEQFLKPKQSKSGTSPTAGHSRRNLKELKLELPSDTSSDLRTAQDSSAVTDISTSESDVATQIAETETATQTEESVSVSTIDTSRLIRAFGHNRVQVSPKLSQLYSTITLQKTRSDTRAKGSRKAVAADYPKGVQVTDSVFSSDSISTIPSSRGPSPALNNKRTKRMLNKAVQAGDLEIVNSATRKNTRDVGFTFPTPTSSQMRFQGSPTNGTEPEGFVSRSNGTQKRLPGSFLAERPRKSKPPWLQGMSWFVPANDLKSYSKEGNEYHFIPDSSPSWFEPVTNAKPWREPLREKNFQEDQEGLQVRLTVPARDIENKPPPPFVKMTLQDALALHRPDFISRSGERVKRLKLIMEERKLQSILQSEREELFNPPEERRLYKSAGYLHPNRDYRVIQRKKNISKDEMVQRSKRIYDQLPEVRKRKEEEKRKSDYSTYRLKAQLYKTKITNRILGRKVPWE